jgi:hypothetical protein
MIPQKVRQVLAPAYHKAKDLTEKVAFFARRKATKIYRLGRTRPTVTTFVVLCVKRNEYARLVVANVNSLHVLNPAYSFRIFVDNACVAAFNRGSGFDYPSLVSIENRYGNDARPWQLLKVESLMTAAEHGWALVDADTVWHGEPTISQEKITFLVRAYNFGEIEAEREFLHANGRTDLLKAPHFVTGFVNIPRSLYNEELRMSTVKWTERAFSDERLRRISEEIGVNIAVQSAFRPEKIQALKETDGPNDRHIMQSLYYGCINDIKE